MRFILYLFGSEDVATEDVRHKSKENYELGRNRKQTYVQRSEIRRSSNDVNLFPKNKYKTINEKSVFMEIV